MTDKQKEAILQLIRAVRLMPAIEGTAIAQDEVLVALRLMIEDIEPIDKKERDEKAD